uniref:RRM domain-containing protein n=1 Tax=Romanomermis culicivorax TaxID=13658 RepID=A0A915J4J4_ROMCU
MIRSGGPYSPNGVSSKRPRLEDVLFVDAELELVEQEKEVSHVSHSNGLFAYKDDFGAGVGHGRYNAPTSDFTSTNLSSRVLQVRNLKDQVMEADLIDALSQFGPIAYVSLTGRGVALVEFEDLSAAERCMGHVLNSDILVLQQPAIFSYSPMQIIPRQGWESDRPNNFVVMYVQNPKYPITTDVVSAICKPICRVSRIVINRDNGQIQCFVEFPDIEAARNIKQRLNGCDIYSGCCTLKIEFAKQRELLQSSATMTLRLLQSAACSSFSSAMKDVMKTKKAGASRRITDDAR